MKFFNLFNLTKLLVICFEWHIAVTETLLDNKNPSDIYIGKNVTISNRVSIYTHSEPPKTLSKFGFNYFEKPIYIDSNVYVGANTTILPGVKIKSNSIIGAGSVVTKDVPSNCIFAGNPARKIKDLEITWIY